MSRSSRRWCSGPPHVRRTPAHESRRHAACRHSRSRHSLPPLATSDRQYTPAGKVVNVHDGDTLRVLDAGGTQHKVRLQGIDSPGTKQAFGTKARKRLADLTLGKAFVVRVHGRDVNRQMMADGMAWHYVKYSKTAGLARAERDARVAGRGLWAGRRGCGKPYPTYPISLQRVRAIGYLRQVAGGAKGRDNQGAIRRKSAFSAD